MLNKKINKTRKNKYEIIYLVAKVTFSISVNVSPIFNFVNPVTTNCICINLKLKMKKNN